MQILKVFGTLTKPDNPKLNVTKLIRNIADTTHLT